MLRGSGGDQTLTVLPDLVGTPKMGALLCNYALIARGILTSLAIFLLLLLALAAGLSVPLSRNLYDALLDILGVFFWPTA